MHLQPLSDPVQDKKGAAAGAKLVLRRPSEQTVQAGSHGSQRLNLFSAFCPFIRGLNCNLNFRLRLLLFWRTAHPMGVWDGEQLRDCHRPLFQEQAALVPGSCPAPSSAPPSYNRGPGFEYFLFRPPVLREGASYLGQPQVPCGDTNLLQREGEVWYYHEDGSFNVLLQRTEDQASRRQRRHQTFDRSSKWFQRTKLHFD